MKPIKKRPLLLRKPAIFIWPAIVVIGVAAIVLYKATSLFRSTPANTSNTAFTKGEVAKPDSATSKTSQDTSRNSSNSSTTEPGDDKSNEGGMISTALVAPTGNFVSNHHPNLSGSPAPNTMNSACTTTPGANCVISFTQDNVTKSLPSQTTDRGGSTYWNNWSLQSIGLTSGSWKIQATATLNGKTMTASDAMTLVVAQ